MKELQIRLPHIEDVKQFVHLAGQYPFEIDLLSGRYVVDGKSVMGIFSLDLKNPITVRVHSDCCADFLQAIAPFTVA